MIEVLALALVTSLGYFRILDVEPVDWFQDHANKWCSIVKKWHIADPSILWLVVVGLPALFVGVLSLIDSLVLTIVINITVLLFTVAIASFMQNHSRLIRAVYANDTELAAKIANSWEKRSDDVVDSQEKFIARMLDLCATRLHIDVLAVVIWYLLLGPAGALLIAMHYVYKQNFNAPNDRRKSITMVNEALTIVMLGICGNLGSALKHLPSFDVAKASLASVDLGGDKMNLEKVPDFGKLLMRTFTCTVGAAIVILVLIVI